MLRLQSALQEATMLGYRVDARILHQRIGGTPLDGSNPFQHIVPPWAHLLLNSRLVRTATLRRFHVQSAF